MLNDFRTGIFAMAHDLGHRSASTRFVSCNAFLICPAPIKDKPGVRRGREKRFARFRFSPSGCRCHNRHEVAAPRMGNSCRQRERWSSCLINEAQMSRLEFVRAKLPGRPSDGAMATSLGDKRGWPPSEHMRGSVCSFVYMMIEWCANIVVKYAA